MLLGSSGAASTTMECGYLALLLMNAARTDGLSQYPGYNSRKCFGSFEFCVCMELQHIPEDGYATLASLSAKLGHMLYQVRPKLHMYCHIVWPGACSKPI